MDNACQLRRNQTRRPFSNSSCGHGSHDAVSRDQPIREALELEEHWLGNVADVKHRASCLRGYAITQLSTFTPAAAAAASRARSKLASPKPNRKANSR